MMPIETFYWTTSGSLQRYNNTPIKSDIILGHREDVIKSPITHI